MAYRGGFRGPGGFTRPENALKRAEELENVGQRNAALQVLHDVITSKKHRTWSKTYESIMFKHIDLVVEMKKRSYGKEALMQYRNMCQAVNINSLEEVIKYFLKKANDKAEEAQKQSADATIAVADLEEDASPEDIMLSYVSGDKSKDRTDREMVTPWFRFLWETYRSVLDILRTNPKLEPVYAMTASKAFQFCLQFKRTVEFRRLCDILRQHLTNLTLRYRDNREAQPDQLQLHLETRFEQLKVACELEMWAEAFRSVEDIQALVALAKKAPKQQLMATYYARLTQIFAVSENHLYHAYAWLKLFNFSRSYNKNMTPADLQAMASSMVLSMLSILPYDHKHQAYEDNAAEQQEKERILRMANILGFAVDSRKDYRSVLSRAALLNSVVGTTQHNIISLVPQEIRSIFELLTNEFSPLELCARMEPLLARLSEASTGTTTMSAASPIKSINLAMYVKQLKQVAVLRLLKQLSEVYSTLRIATLQQLVPFMPFSEVEAVVVDAVKCDYLQVRIDHRNGTLQFGSQQLDSDGMRNHLQLLAARLSKAVAMVAPEPRAPAAAAREAAIRAAADKLAELNVKAIARKALIERRKEEAETALLEAEKEEERRRVAAAREAEAAEERRRKEEAIRREKERIEKELEEQELAEARAMLEAAQKKKAGAPGKPGAKGDDKPLDKRQIMQEALNERFKEAQEMERRMAKLARQQDHLERARREEEVPLLQELADRRETEDRQLFTQLAEAEATRHRAQWEADLAEKHRLSGMVEDKEQFAAMIIARRQEEFEALRKQRARRLAERREQLRQERAVARRREYIRRCQAEIEDRVAELEAERAAAEAERKKAEEAERQRKLDEALAQQRKREAEVEAKLREEKQAAIAGAAAAASAAAATPAAASSTAPAAGGKFVPSVARKTAGADAPPAAAAAGGREDRWGGRRDEPPPARGDDDSRWGGGRRDAAPPSAAPAAGRYAPPVRGAAADGAAAERPAAQPSAAPAATAAPSPAAAPAPKPAGGKFVPPHLRNRG